MKLKDRENFMILLKNEFGTIDYAKILEKTNPKRHARFNRITVNNEITFVFYNIDKKHLFNIAANKHAKFIWKDAKDFYIIDFSNNTKGDIISHLTFDETNGDKIECTIKYLNIKSKYKDMIKIPLVSDALLDENEPFTYEDFCIYEKI